MNTITKILAVFGMITASSHAGSCSEERMVNKYLAQATALNAKSYNLLQSDIKSFSDSNGFAVQEILTTPRGNLDFSVRLFRDDITVLIDRLKGEEISIAAYPLCACQLDRRLGLQEGSEKVVRELRSRLINSNPSM